MLAGTTAATDHFSARLHRVKPMPITMKNHFLITAAIGFVSLACGHAGEAVPDDLRLHNLFQSNMVLQRDKPITVWGWANSGETVGVSFSGQKSQATVAGDGTWKVVLPSMPANAEPQTMTVADGANKLTLDNVLIGDVWIVGGQSNMQHPVSGVEGGEVEIASAHYPAVRLLTIPPVIDDRVKKNFSRRVEGEKETGEWAVCSPKSVGQFSAIGYVFGRRLHMAAQVPIGLIDVSRWGTTVETWTPRATLESIDHAAVRAQLEEWETKKALFDPRKDLDARIQRYKQHNPEGTNPPTEPDPGPQTNQNYPGNGYNSFIAPIAGFGVKGAIYHQGFNNSRADAAEFYHAVFPRMITAWRAAFDDPKMPFGIISLCTDTAPQTLDNYTASMMDHGIYVREAQYRTFLDFYRSGDENIGYASTFNLRHAWYHPQNKIPAGERIARWALATQYGFGGSIKWKPPMVTKVEAVDGKILLHLDTEVTPEERGSEIVGFAVSGKDKKYQPATAQALVTGKDGKGNPRTDQTILVLSSPHVPQPIHYRYAWGRNPMGNLRAGGNDRIDIAFATQRSDDWGFWDVPYLDLSSEQRATKGATEKIRRALSFVDLERRVKDARLLLEKEEREYEAQKSSQK
jgi:sialate O-acetylesterase